MNRSAIAASLLALWGSVVGCTNISQNSPSATEVNDNSQDAKLRSVGVTLGDLSNPFFVVMAKGAEAEAKKIGGNDVKVAVVSSGYDLNQQTNQMENFVAANTDLIILNAADSKGIQAAVDNARKAGQIVIAVDTAVDAEVDATVTTDNVQAGEVACQYMADRLKGKGNVVIVNGPPVSSVIQRVEGCEQVYMLRLLLKIQEG